MAFDPVEGRLVNVMGCRAVLKKLGSGGKLGTAIAAKPLPILQRRRRDRPGHVLLEPLAEALHKLSPRRRECTSKGFPCRQAFPRRRQLVQKRRENRLQTTKPLPKSFDPRCVEPHRLAK